MPQADRKSLPLSPREREIVRMVAQGHQNKIIAVVLNISAWTVCTHLRRIFAKLGVTSRAAMVARLVEFGGIAEQTNGVDQASVGPAAEPSAGARPRRTDALPWSPHRMARPSSVTEDIAPVPRAGVIARPSASRLGADDRVSAETGSRKSL
jgi:DNA-binding CsgD family transcriptional regulator